MSLVLDYGRHIITPCTFRNAEVAVAAGAAGSELVEFHVNLCERLAFRIANVHATIAFDAFWVQYKFHRDGTYVTVASAAGDFTTPVGPVIHKTADPTALAAVTGVVNIFMDITGVFSVRIMASGNAAESTATIEGGTR